MTLAMTDEAQPKVAAAAPLGVAAMPDDLPKWIRPFAYRLGQFKAPGVYRVLLVVNEDGSRALAIENPYAPIKIEALGK